MPHLTRLRLIAGVIAVAAIVPQTSSAQWVLFGWKVSEYQPNIANGGRANTITVNPLNNDHIIVSTESGGLFRSANAGTNWKHIDGMAEFWTNSVAYVPTDTSIVIATASADTRTTNGGGIWRSTNGGFTWTQMAGPPVPGGSTTRLSGFEIAIAPDSGTIYVGTEFGLSISRDNGATWTNVDPFGFNRRVVSVIAQANGRVIVGSNLGIRRSDNSGTNWMVATNGPGAIVDLHALGANPYSRDQAYVMNSQTQLWFTEDGGNNWAQITSAASGGGGCGGITFAKAVRRRRIIGPLPRPTLARGITLYAGNRCGVQRLLANEIGTTGRFDYSGTWTNLTLDHSDTRDIGFNRFNTPVLLATDGGLHNTANGGASWNFVGGGTNGFNALQITEIRGQWIESLGRYDLYFGTQDNNLYASDDGGASWKNPVCCEGFFIEGLRRVQQPSDSHITFVTCGPCSQILAEPLLTNLSNWPAPVGSAGDPVILGKTSHIHPVDSSASFARGFTSTGNLGSTYAQYARVPETRRDIPKMSRPNLFPAVYQSIRAGWDPTLNIELDHLVRITRRFPRPGTSVTYPLMNNFGGLGINPTMFAWYQVFAVDPGNYLHVIAPDIVNEKMMETWNGGDDWTEIPNLTSQITDNGNLLFRNAIFPQASAVSFSSDDPNFVGIATTQNGVFISRDRGATWFKVPGSDVVTYGTSIAWRSPTDAIVSTYGRGLWRIKWGLIRPFPDFLRLCKLPCLLRRFDPVFDPAEIYEHGLLVNEGVIQGARVVNGVLRELFVSPGASVVFFSNTMKESDIKITETRRMVGFTGINALRNTGGNKIVGLALGKRNNVLAAAYSDKPLSSYEQTEKEVSQEKQDQERPESPRAGKPYIEIVTSGPSGANIVAPGSVMRLSAVNFPKGQTVEVVVDSMVVDKGRADERGRLAFEVRAPLEVGLHRVVLRDAETKKVIDGAMFLVRNTDDREGKRIPIRQRVVNR